MELILLALVVSAIVAVLLFSRSARNKKGKANPNSGGGSGNGDAKDNNQGDQSY